MPQRDGREGKIEEIPDHDVDEDAEVVCVEVLVCERGGEEEVEELEDEELEGGFAFAVQEQDDVLAEGFVAGAVRGEGFYHFVGEGGGGDGWLGGGGIVGGDHVLFV